VNEALALLKFMPKKGANIIYKVVHSAAYNAKNNFKQSIDDLFITKLLVTKGPTYKRSLPVARGRTHPILKRTSHITVEVGVLKDEATKRRDDETAKKEKPVKKITTKKSEKPAPSKVEGKADKKETKKK
jgi:large subunit ribosomal protein L22